MERPSLQLQFCRAMVLNTRMGEGKSVHRVLVGKSEGKRPLGRPRCRWEDNIKDGSSGNGTGLWGLDGVGLG